MPPDLNSLPPSPSPSSNSPLQPRSMASPIDPTRTQSPSHTPPTSLAAAAAMNAGMQNEDTRRTSSGSMRREVERARRRSSIRMNLNLNDPAVPAPGEMQRSPSSGNRGPWLHSPHHERAPSLGELHQELEYEQEGQVNRLLNMIRQQQAQILTLQANQQPLSSSAVDDSTPTSERSMSLSQNHPQPAHTSQPSMSPLPAAGQPRSRSPFGLGNVTDRSRGSSHHGSPALRPMSGQGGAHESYDWLPTAATTTGRDESAFYQAETQNLTRENQMLKLRIRELERQLADLNPTGPITHSPVVPSGLHSNPAISGQQDIRTITETAEPSSTSTTE